MSDSTQASPAATDGDAEKLALVSEKVVAELRRGAYISAVSMPARCGPAIPIPIPFAEDQGSIGGFQSEIVAHRLRVQETTPKPGQGLRATNAAGRLHFDLSQRLTVIPDGYSPRPGTALAQLDRSRSQAINLTGAEFTFDSDGKNRFRGSATGRTIPMVLGGEKRLLFGANGEITSGSGIFEGVIGSYVINGEIGLSGPSFQILIRIQDSSGQFETRSDLTSLTSIEDPDPEWTVMTFLGREDPASPVQQKFEDGALVGGHVTELLSPSWLDFDNGRRGKSLRTLRRTGAQIGKLETDIQFAPPMPPTEQPIPFATAHTKITFNDTHGSVVGTIGPNIDEGQAILMPLANFSEPMPSFRIVGFGEITGGTGLLEGVCGLMSVNSIIAVAPAALFNMYVFRFYDPEHKLRVG